MRRTRGLLMATMLVGLAAGLNACDTRADAADGRVDGATAHKLVADGARLLDVRTVAEFNQGHLPGAVLIPYDELGARASEVGAKDHPVVVYCRSGHRSGIARETLRSLGFTAVYDLGPKTAW